MKLFCSILLLACICTTTSAETVRLWEGDLDVSVTLTPTQITVGDLVTLQIEASAPIGFSLSLQNDKSYGSFTVVESQQLLDIPTNARRSWTWSMQLDTFDAETTSLEGLAIDWTSNTGKTGRLSVAPIVVSVQSVAGDALQSMSIRDIKGAVPLLSKSSLLAFIASGATCIALIILLVRFFKGNKPAISHHEIAIKAITELKHSNLDVQPFYTTLSDIVRHYLEGRFQIPATGQTTREFLNDAKQNTRLESTDRESLGTFLVAADLVKFARHEPTANVNEDAIHQAEVFIEETSEELV
jgi:hypothetical protein